MIEYSVFTHTVNRQFEKLQPSNRYILYIAMMGAMMAITQFGVIIARKSLNASELMVTFIAMSTPVMSLTSLWWARLIKGRDQRPILLVVVSIGLLAIASGALLHNIWHLLIIHCIWFLAFSLLRTSETRALQRHVSANKTGKTFGKGASFRMIMVAAISGLAGLWMENVEGGYRNIYPLISLVGVVGMLSLASIKVIDPVGYQAMPLNSHFFLEPLRKVVKLLKRRPDFFRYECVFMIFGGSFMMTNPVVPVFLVDNLELGYDTIGFSRGTISQLTSILAIFIFGKVFDKTTPHRFGAYLFCAMSLYPIILLSTEHFDGWMRNLLIYTTFAYFGIVMSGVMVLWQLASIRFSGDEDAGIYHSVHVTATGIRGLIAPLTGYFIMKFFSIHAALLTSSCLFLTAGVMMVVIRWIDYRRGEGISLRA